MHATAEQNTDFEMLSHAFGTEYFICQRLKNKVTLDSGQQEQLHQLISERNHFGILNMVISLRRKD